MNSRAFTRDALRTVATLVRGDGMTITYLVRLSERGFCEERTHTNARRSWRAYSRADRRYSTALRRQRRRAKTIA